MANRLSRRLPLLRSVRLYHRELRDLRRASVHGTRRLLQSPVRVRFSLSEMHSKLVAEA
jgi:hypothetical protein